MCSLLILVAATATGIDVGWQPLPEGGYEYTIQIEPELAETFLRGEHEIVSSVPDHIEARRYRIVVGSNQLARINADSRAEAVPRSRAIEPQRPGAKPPVGNAPRKSREEQPAAESEPPLEPVAQPEPSMPAAADAAPLQNLPAPPAESGPAIAIPQEPVPVAESQPSATSPFTHSRAADEGRVESDASTPGLAETPPKLLQSAYQEATQANRPKSDAATAGGATTGPERPWTAFVLALVLLCCSIGANAYLGWVAWDARARYRQALVKLGAAGAT
jgi:hypothetical protein